jgi:hypothetical protein
VELLNLRVDKRVLTLANDLNIKDLEELRASQKRLLDYQGSMSFVKEEYRLQEAEGYLAKNMEAIRVENQDLKIKLSELRL